MVTDDDAADVFTISNFWASPSWLKPEPEEETTRFFTLDVAELGSRVKLDPIVADNDGFFRNPPLDSGLEQESVQKDEPATEESSDSDALFSDDPESTTDHWLLDEPRKTAPGYKTWDAFNVPNAPRPEALCITEAGAAVYDALLSLHEDPLKLKNVDRAVVDTKAYMAALLAAAVGRESVLFSFPASKSFTPILPKIRISGHSADVLQGLQHMSIECGDMFQRLQGLVESTYERHATPVRVALASALNGVLGIIEASMAAHSRQARSMLQMQTAIRDISSILSQLDKLVENLRPGHSDEAILLAVFRRAETAEYKDVYVRDTMREILQRIARPWLDSMEEWLGVRPESGAPLTKDNLGQRKGFVRVEAETYIDDFGLEVVEADFRLDRESIPEFMPDDIAEKLFETGKNLRFIRSNHPDHPLSMHDRIAANDPPRTEWLYDWDSILELERRVSEYQASLSAMISKSRSENRAEREVASDPHDEPASHELQIFGAETSQIEHHILSSMEELGQPLQVRDRQDKLKETIRVRLSHGHSIVSAESCVEFSPHWSLLPTLSFGPLVMAHGRIVNRESLRLLFTAHGLQKHIQLQRQFHLFGNGVFTSRLSHALFDPDLETAERQQGVARQGGVMGLRLSGRDNWPPASSELRLALMGILAESYTPGSSDWVRDFPGDMSFAVRDMAPEDVDKCMDQDSLEALDFLRLSYKPPAALASIMTPGIMMQYDRIFKLMLRVLRLLYVINRLSRDINSRARRWHDPGNAAVRFCFEARHFVDAISSYFSDVGISMPWVAFEHWLGKVEDEVTDDGSPIDTPGGTYSPERLRACHSLVLDHIMHALLLRKRQMPVLKLLEEIFSCILQFAKCTRAPLAETGVGPDVGGLYQTFRKKVGVFITVCRGLNEKGDLGLKRASTDGVEDGLAAQMEGNAIEYLLTRLDTSSYYSRTGVQV